jgi:hypothetical protein
LVETAPVMDDITDDVRPRQASIAVSTVYSLWGCSQLLIVESLEPVGLTVCVILIITLGMILPGGVRWLDFMSGGGRGT